MLRMWQKYVILVAGLALLGCSRSLPFSEYEQNFFPETAITQSQTKIIKVHNPHDTQPQHIRAIDFDSGGNAGGHFVIEQVTVGGRPIDTRDIQVPPGGNISLHVTYHPVSLETTEADFGGWETGGEARFVPHAPKVKDTASETDASTTQSALLGASSKDPVYDEAHDVVHRALMMLTYDHPREGVMRIELVGAAVAGPNGEISTDPLAPAAAASECPPNSEQACFLGELGLSIPALLDQEYVQAMQGPWLFDNSDGVITAEMKDFPVTIFTVEGGGLPTTSIVVSGHVDTTASGSITDGVISLTGAAFRVRVILGAVTASSLSSASPLADFIINDVTLESVEPDSGHDSQLQANVTLDAVPSGVVLVDDFLGGQEIIVNVRGALDSQ